MTTKLKLVDESPLFAKHHNSVWDAELTLLRESSGQSCDERFPPGSYLFKVPKVFKDQDLELSIDNVVVIGENHLTLFAWLTTDENCGMVALEVLT